MSARIEDRISKLEALLSAVREFRRWDSILALTMGDRRDAEDAQDNLRAIDAALFALDSPPRCQCQWEAGDSPCDVHGENEECHE